MNEAKQRFWKIDVQRIRKTDVSARNFSVRNIFAKLAC
jgi:hypothetical protein